MKTMSNSDDMENIHTIKSNKKVESLDNIKVPTENSKKTCKTWNNQPTQAKITRLRTDK